MNQCVRVNCLIEKDKEVLSRIFQEEARKLRIEGILKLEPENMVAMVACGDKEVVQKFLDVLHKYHAEQKLRNLEIEPFLKDKDYRGVFRVIE
jgi:acylphosphatase